MSGVAVHVGEDTPRVSFQGRDYFVCCDGCAEQLRADPTHFLEPACRSSS